MSLFFEEYITQEEGMAPKCLGVRRVTGAELDPGRRLGSEGMKYFTLTEPIELERCFKKVTVKASKAKPLPVVTMVHRLS